MGIGGSIDCPPHAHGFGKTRAADPPAETAADTRVVGLFEGEKLADAALARLVELGEAKPGLRKVAVAHEDAPGGGRRRVLLAGLGKREELDPERARVAAAAVAARASELGAVSLSWAAPAGDGVAGALVEGTLLRLYRFDRFKSREDDDGRRIESLELAGEDVPDARGRARAHRQRVRQRGPRPAEPALERGHPHASWPSAPPRSRPSTRRSSSSCSTATRSWPAAWAPSPPWRRAPTSSRA